jgi:hypothetical protein
MSEEEREREVPVWLWVLLVVTALVVFLPPVLMGAGHVAAVYARWWSYWFAEPLLPRVP